MAYDQDELGIGGGIWAAGVATVISSYLALSQILRHSKNLVYPEAQQMLYGIFILPMLVSWSSWLILLLGEELGVLEFAGDIAKALTVMFFTLYVIRLLGYEHNGVRPVYNPARADQVLAEQQHVSRLCKCCGQISVATEEEAQKFLRGTLIATIQYLIVLIALFFISIILAIATDEDRLQYAYINLEAGYTWVTIVKTISMAGALYNMIVFASASNAFEALKDLNMGDKFKLVQLSCLITQPQSVVIGLFADWGLIADTDEHSAEEITLFTLHLILCIEMVIVAFAQHSIFPVDDYEHLTEKPMKDSEAVTP